MVLSFCVSSEKKMQFVTASATSATCKRSIRLLNKIYGRRQAWNYNQPPQKNYLPYPSRSIDSEPVQNTSHAPHIPHIKLHNSVSGDGRRRGGAAAGVSKLGIIQFFNFGRSRLCKLNRRPTTAEEKQKWHQHILEMVPRGVL